MNASAVSGRIDRPDGHMDLPSPSAIWARVSEPQRAREHLLDYEIITRASVVIADLDGLALSLR
ncbi:hypothetical protein [Streptosporangium sp. NPDC049376]|uniref:hypothetical protein n=1 Tax=Streptosporangium sp. NPDC049376 TaxID=3366192 RepID=UPI0037A4B4E4